MENLGKKAGYLKGLMEGLDVDADSGQGRLLAGIVDLLGDLTDRVEAVDELVADLNDYVESIDDDLAALEGEGDDLDDFGDDDEGFDDVFGEGEDRLHLLRSEDFEEPTDGEEQLAGNLCPACGKMFFTALDDPDGAQYECPHCKQRVTPVPLTPENAPVARPIEEE